MLILCLCYAFECIFIRYSEETILCYFVEFLVWTENDVLDYLRTYKIPYASVYGDILENEDGTLYTTGCARTGCVFCLFGAHAEKEPGRLQKLKISHPQLYKYCMKPWEEGGLGMKDIIDKFNSLAPKAAHIYY